MNHFFMRSRQQGWWGVCAIVSGSGCSTTEDVDAALDASVVQPRSDAKPTDAPDPRQDGIDSSRAVDAAGPRGEHRPSCVLPCVWEQVVDCLPPPPGDACTTDSWDWIAPAGFPQATKDGASVTACGVATRWVRESFQSGVGWGEDTRFYATSLCAKRESRITITSHVVTWYDTQGRVIAEGSTTSPDAVPEVLCVDGRSAVGPDGQPLSDACPPGQDTFEPALAACTQGTCDDPDPSDYLRQ